MTICLNSVIRVRIAQFTAVHVDITCQTWYEFTYMYMYSGTQCSHSVVNVPVRAYLAWYVKHTAVRLFSLTQVRHNYQSNEQLLNWRTFYETPRLYNVYYYSCLCRQKGPLIMHPTGSVVCSANKCLQLNAQLAHGKQAQAFVT